MAETVVLFIVVVSAAVWAWRRLGRARAASHPDQLGAALSRGRAKQSGFRSGPLSGQDGGSDQTGAR